MIRNHAEVAVKPRGIKNLVNMVGWNYRMTEIEAAIAFEQLKKFKRLFTPRVEAAEYLTKNLTDNPFLKPPKVKTDCVHGYYVYPVRYDGTETGIHRDRFIKALNAEGIPMTGGYTEPIYFEPLYQQRIAFGKDGFPFTYSGYKGKVDYQFGICPVCEQMYYHELMITDICHANIIRDDLNDMLTAIDKVCTHIEELK